MPLALEVLIVSHDEEVRLNLLQRLARVDLDAVVCSAVSELRGILPRRPICMVITDSQLPDGTFQSVLEEVNRSAAPIPVIVVSRRGDWTEWQDALNAGAFDYLDCRCSHEELERILRAALQAGVAHASQPLQAAKGC